MKKVYENNKIFIWALIFVTILQLIYLSIASTNVPIMDYWKYINMFVEKLNTGGITFYDLWQNDGIHRSPLQFLFFIINVRIFQLNSQVEIYSGAILMAIIAIILYKCLKREVHTECKVLNGLFGIAIIIIVFNLNQYEIINEQFALSFAARIILFLVSYILTSKFLQNIGEFKKYTFELGVLYVFVIASVGSGFFPAYVMALGCVIVLNYIIKYHEEKNIYLKQYVILVLFLAVGTIIYLNGISEEVSIVSERDLSLVLFIIDLIKGVLIMIGVAIIGFTYSENITILFGAVFLVLFLVSFIIYIKKKYYKKTYVPIIFYLYSAGAMGLIYLGRSERFGLAYAYSPRYVGETNIALLAFLWIVVLYITEHIEMKKIKLSKLKNLLIISLVVMMVGIVNSDYTEFQIAPYRKNYGENLIQNMLEIDSLESQDFASFQAREESVRSAVEIMKKYQLGIFKYNNYVEEKND